MRAPARLAALAVCLVLPSASARAADVAVSFDIKPTSCPNPLNPGQQLIATFPTAILGTDSLDVNDIQQATLVLVVPDGGGRGEGIFPVQVGIEDVATAFVPPEPCACIDEGPDTKDDLTIHFDATEVQEAVGSVPGELIPLCIQGQLDDGSTFEGCDCVLVLGPVSVETNSWGSVKATYR